MAQWLALIVLSTAALFFFYWVPGGQAAGFVVNSTSDDADAAPGDGDGGANNSQNFPETTSAVDDGSGFLQIAGTMSSAPNTSCIMELFSSPACDPSGYGEGEHGIGSTSVTTDGNGEGFYTLFALSVPGDTVARVTSTALPHLAAVSTASRRRSAFAPATSGSYVS